MISIRNDDDLTAAFNGALHPALRALLQERREQLPGDLSDIAHFIIVQPGDKLEEVEKEAGIPLASNLVDGTRLGQPGFDPCFEFVERHASGWIEAVLILSDDGFGIALFVPDRIDVDPDFRLLLAS